MYESVIILPYTKTPRTSFTSITGIFDVSEHTFCILKAYLGIFSAIVKLKEGILKIRHRGIVIEIG